MKLKFFLGAALALGTALTSIPAAADPGNGRGHGRNKEVHNRHDRDHRRDDHRRDRRDDRRDDRRGDRYIRYVADCPPGLAKKNPPCIPPGQVGKRDRDYDRDYFYRDGHRYRYGRGVGDVLRVGDYLVIRDRDRDMYDLDYRDGWDYYRDQDRVYRVDRGTRQILAVMNLIDAFAN